MKNKSANGVPARAPRDVDIMLDMPSIEAHDCVWSSEAILQEWVLRASLESINCRVAHDVAELCNRGVAEAWGRKVRLTTTARDETMKADGTLHGGESS